MGRELSTSSILIGSRNMALGFRAAHLRVATAISASCSEVVPYWCMWRVQAIAYEPAGRGSPNGSSNCPGNIWLVSLRGAMPTLDRPLCPWVINATSHSPLAMAVIAWPT